MAVNGYTGFINGYAIYGSDGQPRDVSRDAFAEWYDQQLLLYGTAFVVDKYDHIGRTLVRQGFPPRNIRIVFDESPYNVTELDRANLHLATAILQRIASMQAVTIAGVIDKDSNEGRELIGRIDLARDALDIMGVKHSASPDLSPVEQAEIDRQVREFAKGVDPEVKAMLSQGHKETEEGGQR